MKIEVEDIGRTHEGNELRMLRIVNPGKPHVYIQSGIEARTLNRSFFSQKSRRTKI